MMNAEIGQLQAIAKELRIDVLRSITEAGSGHTGASLGLADVFTCLYFKFMKHNPQQPHWDDRDRLILSIGHAAPILYTALAHAGYFAKEELLTLRKLGSRLQGHPGRDFGLPGIELSAGSLGQGLSVAVGMALAAKMDNKDYSILCILGDGELQEGSVWEAAMSAAHHRLNNLIAIVDYNKLQIDGTLKNVMNIEPLDNKWKAFGWNVLHCDGHDIQNFLNTLNLAKSNSSEPSVILAHTIMGKGVKSIENNHEWHGKAPTNEQLPFFMQEVMNS